MCLPSGGPQGFAPTSHQYEFVGAGQSGKNISHFPLHLSPDCLAQLPNPAKRVRPYKSVLFHPFCGVGQLGETIWREVQGEMRNVFARLSRPYKFVLMGCRGEPLWSSRGQAQDLPLPKRTPRNPKMSNVFARLSRPYKSVLSHPFCRVGQLGETIWREVQGEMRNVFARLSRPYKFVLMGCRGEPLWSSRGQAQDLPLPKRTPAKSKNVKCFCQIVPPLQIGAVSPFLRGWAVGRDNLERGARGNEKCFCQIVPPLRKSLSHAEIIGNSKQKGSPRHVVCAKKVG